MADSGLSYIFRYLFLWVSLGVSFSRMPHFDMSTSWARATGLPLVSLIGAAKAFLARRSLLQGVIGRSCAGGVGAGLGSSAELVIVLVHECLVVVGSFLPLQPGKLPEETMELGFFVVAPMRLCWVMGEKLTEAWP